MSWTSKIIEFLVKILFLWPQILTIGFAIAALVAMAMDKPIWVLFAILAVVGFAYTHWK